MSLQTAEETRSHRSFHSCDIDGRVACWGDNSFGQLDVPTIEPICVMPEWKLRWNFLVLDE